MNKTEAEAVPPGSVQADDEMPLTQTKKWELLEGEFVDLLIHLTYNVRKSPGVFTEFLHLLLGQF